MNIRGFHGILFLGVVPLIFYPAVSAAWFFSSPVQAAQEEYEIPHDAIKSSDLMVPLLAMANNLKHDPEIEPMVDSESALVAEIGARGTLADVIDIPANDTISVYTVAPGDTISTIAEQFNVSVNTIYWANNLTRTSVLRAGQQITILPITGVRHVVAKGDTVGSIAKKYNADSDEILSYNGLDAETLIVGTTIIIPAGELSSVSGIASSVQSRITGSSVRSGVSVDSGYYIRPITLTGDPRIRKTQGFHDHDNAIDIGAPVGTPVLAMADGVVVVTRSPLNWNGGFGGFIAIDHPNGTQTIYAHLSTISVNAGQQVRQGDVIGYVGSTGRSTGPHLHFAIHGVYPTPKLY